MPYWLGPPLRLGPPSPERNVFILDKVRQGDTAIPAGELIVEVDGLLITPSQEKRGLLSYIDTR